jgi:hypothetical protein
MGPEESLYAWSLYDKAEGPVITRKRTGPIGITDLNTHTCNTIVMGVRQGGWVYLLNYSEHRWLNDRADHVYNLEPLCETPPPRV